MNTEVSSIKVNEFNKYLRKDGGKIIIDYIDEDCKFIANDKDILCDRIEILEGIGVLIYLKGMLIKRIKEYALQIDFCPQTNSITISTYPEGNRLLLIYYNEHTNKRLNKMFSDLSATKYKVGDMVYPNNVQFLSIGDRGGIQSLQSLLFLYKLNLMKYGEDKDFTEEHFNSMTNNSAFEIIEIVDNMYYRIRVKDRNTEDSLLKTVVDKDYYATDRDICTLEEIVEQCKRLI